MACQAKLDSLILAAVLLVISSPSLNWPLPGVPGVQYYSAVSSLLDRILDLLLGFIRRTHHALAAVGVAAMTRLILAAGSQMDEHTWMVVSEPPWLQNSRGEGCRSLACAPWLPPGWHCSLYCSAAVVQL